MHGAVPYLVSLLYRVSSQVQRAVCLEDREAQVGIRVLHSR